ncbi:MAG: Ig-like domain-containing protein [Gemmatimonadetes bacterium]|nr:Ig-like domain-containing protein [Gemmatimonadota bacterium]
MQKLSRSLIALGGLAALAACGDDVSITPPATIPAAVVGVTVSPTSLTLKVGESATLGVSVETTGGAGTGVTWSSSSNTVATVSATGTVTAVAAGNTTVRATSTVDNTKSGAAQVTVTAPAVRSVTVSPTALALTVGQTATAVATVDRDAPLAGTVTWASSTQAVATVSAAGLITGVSAGTSVITATSTADNTKSAALAVTVSPVPNNLLSLNVAPTNVNIGPGASQQLTATVNTVGTPTVTYTYTSGNTGVATVSNTGLVTGVAQGTTVITVSASTSTNTLTTSVTVNVNAASVSISSLTTCTGTPVCTVIPVNLAGVAGQIEATLNINSGAQQISKVDVLIDNVVAATQNFGVNGAPNAPVTLSINTAEFDANYVPKWINGPRTIAAKITPATGGTPTASNTIQFTLTNADVVYFNASGLTHTGNSATGPSTAAGTTYWKGGFTFSAFPVSYSGQIASITYNSDDCGSAGATAAPWVATFSCSGVENFNGNEQSIQNSLGVTYNTGYTLTAAPTAFMTAATAGYVPGKPVYAAVLTNEDNVGPTSPAPTLTNQGAAGGAGGVWLGTPAGFSSVATDAGVGMGTQPTINGHTNTSGYPLLNAGITNVCSAGIASNSNMPETLNPTSYVAQATGAVDALGNAGAASAVSGAFGVDCAVTDVKYLNQSGGSPAAATVYTTATQTAFNALPANVNVGGEAIDMNGRSGLWNVNAPFSDAHGPMVQTIARLAPGVNSNCYAGPQGPFSAVGVSYLWENMPTVLTNNYVQSTPTSLFCAGLSGYYTWSANVWDRALNSKAVPYHTTSATSVVTALDLLAPNVTGIGFVNPLYTGGNAAPFSISANDDLEVINARIGLQYIRAAAGDTLNLRYPFGSTGLSLNNGTGTNQQWGVKWDNAIASTLNAGEASVNFFVARIDSVIDTSATNLSSYVPAGDSLNRVAVEVADVFGTASNMLTAGVLNTQLTIATTQFGGLGTNMTGFRARSTAAGQLIMEQVGISGTATQQCTSFILWRENISGGTTNYDYVSALSSSPTITDNGTNRFFAWTVTGLTTGNYRAMCVRNGTGLLTTTIAVA